jgi:hypothetical protein
MIYVLEINYTEDDDYGHTSYTQFTPMYWEDEFLAKESASRIRKNKSDSGIDLPVKYDKLWNKVFTRFEFSCNGMFETFDNVTVREFYSVDDFVNYLNEHNQFGVKTNISEIKSPNEVIKDKIYNICIKSVYTEGWD